MTDTATREAPAPTVLHYVGYDDDRGGIVSVVRAFAGTGRFACVLGVNPGFVQRRTPPLATLELPAIEGERLNLRTLWRARVVAGEVRRWLRGAPNRAFHGHSRAGLLVGWWLRRMGEPAVVVSVHCLGRQRWFYRWMASALDGRLFWLGPSMKRHYGMDDTSWAGCVPDAVVLPEWSGRPRRSRADGTVRFACVGALVPVKQWELVLHALARVPAAVPLRVVYAGGEDGTSASAAYAKELRRLAAAPGVAARVEWRSQMDDMAAFYAETDCLIVASRWEASSMAVLEAAATGVPVLTADAAGTCDLVAAGNPGWRFRADDVEDLARMLAMLVETGALATAGALPGPDWRFEARRVAGEWAEIYRRAQS